VNAGQHLRLLRWAVVAAVAAALLSLAPFMTSGTELARVRNALVFDTAPAAAFDWTPDRTPGDFLLDSTSPTDEFTAIVVRLGLDREPDDWARGLAISSYLLTSAPRLVGGAVQAGLHETVQRITQRGEGYCADFVRVFEAVAAAAGMQTRAWAFSFDGYGGNGHVLPEIWNRQAGRWQALDVFNNVYFMAPDGRPLAALELRESLERGGAEVTVRPLVRQARPGFVAEAKLRDYYHRGLDEWYLWWGSNPFDYDHATAALQGGVVRRGLGQIRAVALGVQPRVKAVVLPTNGGEREGMQRLRLHLLAVVLVVGLGLLLLLLSGMLTWRRVAGASHAD
jgi:hypothetical protein